MIVDRSYRMSAAWIDEQINAYKRQTVQINANRVNVCLALAFVGKSHIHCTSVHDRLVSAIVFHQST